MRPQMQRAPEVLGPVALEWQSWVHSMASFSSVGKVRIRQILSKRCDARKWKVNDECLACRSQWIVPPVQPWCKELILTNDPPKPHSELTAEESEPCCQPFINKQQPLPDHWDSWCGCRAVPTVTTWTQTCMVHAVRSTHPSSLEASVTCTSQAESRT